jgi:hypothetical protein
MHDRDALSRQCGPVGKPSAGGTVGAFYFTVSVFSTVGFGDITPKTDLARIVVTAQMLLDLLLLATVVRVYFGAAHMRAARRSRAGDG